MSKKKEHGQKQLENYWRRGSATLPLKEIATISLKERLHIEKDLKIVFIFLMYEGNDFDKRRSDI